MLARRDEFPLHGTPGRTLPFKAQFVIYNNCISGASNDTEKGGGYSPISGINSEFCLSALVAASFLMLFDYE